MIPVFLFAPGEEGDWPPGAASRWWLHHSLAQLEASLQKLDLRLIVRPAGDSLATLRALVRETDAAAVYWNRRWEPASMARDTHVKQALRADGLEVRSFNAALLREPTALRTQTGDSYKVFTPYWKACLRLGDPPRPLPVPALHAPAAWPKSDSLDSLDLLPKLDWAVGFGAVWKPGEIGAHANLERFLEAALPAYPEARDIPAVAGTSLLSPHLHFGEISPRQIWHALHDRLNVDPRGGATRGGEKFLAEVGWREFAHQLLYFFPHTPAAPLHAQFARFPWRKAPAALKAWQRGRTGYPFVDAGMRELWATGYMHNRVRMIVGSFLVKDLLLPWQQGAAWFWDTLVDADLANNTLGWQWVAGCGADASPYFRIFNPVTQGKKFDANGDYIRRWVPELAKLSDKWIHEPWLAPAEELARAGLTLGKDYPRPIVDHAEARDRALEALATMKRGA